MSATFIEIGLVSKGRILQEFKLALAGEMIQGVLYFVVGNFHEATGNAHLRDKQKVIDY